MLLQPPKFHHERQPSLPYPLQRTPVPTVLQGGWATGTVWSGAENVVPTL
jgi:hypothetical protein